MLLALTGCDQASLKEKFTQLRRGFKIGFRWKPGQNPAPSASLSSDVLNTEVARIARVNGELLKEMFHVVFMQEPKNRSEFGSWLDSLNQGASLEGVYNGFTHSSTYRGLEQRVRGSSPRAVEIFSQELYALESELSAATAFDDSSSQPLATPLSAEDLARGQSGMSSTPLDLDLSRKRSSAKQTPETYEKLFARASIFTLKRVLGDEVLKVIAEKSKTAERLPKWFAKTVVRLTRYDVDFGLPLRNRADEEFHREWASHADGDKLRWEMLNRYHRLLNATKSARR